MVLSALHATALLFQSALWTLRWLYQRSLWPRCLRFQHNPSIIPVTGCSSESWVSQLHQEPVKSTIRPTHAHEDRADRKTPAWEATDTCVPFMAKSWLLGLIHYEKINKEPAHPDTHAQSTYWLTLPPLPFKMCLPLAVLFNFGNHNNSPGNQGRHLGFWELCFPEQEYLCEPHKADLTDRERAASQN